MFNEDFEDKVLATLLLDRQSAKIMIVAGLTKNHFTSKLSQRFGNMCINFMKSYDCVFTNDSFAIFLDNLIKSNKMSKDDVGYYVDKYKQLKTEVDLTDMNFVVSETVEYIKFQELKKFSESLVMEWQEKRNYEAIQKSIQKVLNIGSDEQTDVYNYYDKVEDRVERRSSGIEMGISTGIEQLDRSLPGRGFRKKELTMLVGASKMGKTQALLWFAHQATTQGKNVVFFSCETSREVLEDRLDALNSNHLINELQLRGEQVVDIFKQLDTNKRGKLIVSEHPSGSLKVSKSEVLLDRYEGEHEFNTDMAIYDYSKIMMPEIDRGDERVNLSEITVGIRGVAGDRNICTMSAAQLNRKGNEKKVTQATDVGTDFSQIQTADLILGINASDTEKLENQIRFSIVIGRNVEPKTFLIKHDYARGKFFTSFLGTEGLG